MKPAFITWYLLCGSHRNQRQPGNAMPTREFAVISGNHGVISVQEAMGDIRVQTDTNGATYDQIITIHEPLSHRQIHVSTVLYH
ncbi:DUF1471 domain-containing protein [Edwardsiella ictaluri]|uniref:DUF1471 domain-containing protein n=1 Tax=Edwardsiella ictaluri TaxID=67780 RepID=UPI0009BEF053|nr:DUF1471 domain-containing protein [Edwardsiella ictaluri]ARD40147.1 hypothetical protein B6E78_12885 [Edwardsiella ictaluri]QPW25691.1 DUF1471 domain-containing protein [Edwardsiella ictaluri]